MSENQSKITIPRSLWAALPWLVLLLLLVLVLATGRLVQTKKAAEEARKKSFAPSQTVGANVVTQKIIPIRLTDRIDLPAKVTAWEDLMVMAEVTGTVVELPVKEGDHVAKGQVLAHIDHRDYQALTHSIEARQQLAATNFHRLEGLLGSGAVSQEQFDTAAATLKELEAGLSIAKLNLERCDIRAPMAGVINSLPAKQGMLLAHSDPVAQIIDISRLKVEVAIPESEVTAVRQINQATVVLTSLNNRRISGSKYFLASQPLSAAMVYTLKLAIDNPTGDILPGMFGRAEIIKKIYDQALAVPLFSVITQNDSRFVFVVEEGIAKRRQVETGILEDWKIQLVKGVQPDDQVVIVGHRGLEDGQPVNILKTVTDPEEITL